MKISKPSGEPFNGIIKEVDIHSDLARITTGTKLQVRNPFNVVESPPEIGQMCIWGGYPRLVGEPSPRLRFAQGMVSSEVYNSREGVFFELDGMFNSGHSGSAVINRDTGNLVGIVIKSAGSLEKEFENAINIFKVIEAIQSKWRIFEQTRDEIEKMWDSVSAYIENLNSQISDINSQLGSFGVPFMNRIKTSYFSWHHSQLITEVDGKLPDNVIKFLEEMDIGVSVSDSDTTDVANTDQAFTALFRLVIQWTELIRSATEESYQLGIGIAACEDSISRVI